MSVAGYTKLFASLLDSTIWQTDAETRCVWITLLAMADARGIINASVPGIAHRARVPMDVCERALEAFTAPDPYSRSSSAEGRRIEAIEGGYRLINHGRYRAMRDEAERRTYQAEWVARRRQMSTPVDNVDRSRPQSTQAEAEAEAEAKREKSASLSPAAPIPTDPTPDPFVDATITERAGRFLERYADLYPKHLNGARYLLQPRRDYQKAVELCATWTDDARLDKLATIFLTTDHKFAAEGSRTIPQFAALASWCDARLAEWEQRQGVA